MLQLVAPRGVCEGLPRAWGGLFPCRRRRRSFVTPLMLRGDGSPARCMQRAAPLTRASPRFDFEGVSDVSEMSL